MQTPDRLAAYLADELDPADRAALDDELARDGQLRAALAAMRRADEALTELATPTPEDGFDARTDAFVDRFLAELDADAPAPATATAATTDTDTDRSRWILAVAAAVILLAGVGIATLQPFGEDETAEDRAELSSLDDQSTEAATESADDMDAAGTSMLPLQPSIVDDGRVLDDDELDALLTEPVLTEVVAAELDRAQGTDVGLELQRRLGRTGADTPDDAPNTESAPQADDQLLTRTGDPVSDELLADTRRCLDTLLEVGPTAIPVYVELATVRQQQVLVFGLVTIDPQDDAFTRREVWTLDRDTCQVLRFAQG